MSKIIVNNIKLRREFYRMIAQSKNKPLKTRVFCVSASSGKGKTTLINYFVEYCKTNKIIPVQIDFGLHKFSNSLDIMNMVMREMQAFFPRHKIFPHYEKAIKGLSLSSSPSLVLQGMSIINTSIETIQIQNNVEAFQTLISLLSAEFIKDLCNVTSTTPIVFFLDTFEKASNKIEQWVYEHFVFTSEAEQNFFVVLASQQNFDFPIAAQEKYGISIFRLPDTYDLSDWIEYGKQANISETDKINRCFECYKGEPFCMCIALRPFESKGEIG